MRRNIVLIGMMGSGKTMIAKVLAQRFDLKLFSIDVLIEKKSKASIKTVVDQKGWDYFRALEHKIVLQVAKKKGVVIDCGGGVVLNPESLKALRKNGIIFFIKAGPAVIYRRIKEDKTRPLISGLNPLAEIRRIYKSRLPLYNQADFIINASAKSIEGPVAQIAQEVSI